MVYRPIYPRVERVFAENPPPSPFRPRIFSGKRFKLTLLGAGVGHKGLSGVAILLQLVAQCADTDAQGLRSLRAVARRLAQGRLDRLLLDVVQLEDLAVRTAEP